MTLLGLAVIAVILAVFILLFRIRKVEISGNAHYSTAVIEERLMPDALSRNSLYLTWKYRDGSVEEEIPFLSQVEVKMVSPFHVRIEVTEKVLIGSFHAGDQNIYFDQKGVILEQTQEVYPDIPLISGVELGEVVLYQKLPVDDTALYQTILSICQIVNQQKLLPDEIQFDAEQNIILSIQGVEVQLGRDEYLEEKISNLIAILPNLSGRRGTLDMKAFTGKNEAITFQEAEAVEPEPEEPDTDTGDGDNAGGEGGDDGDDGGNTVDVPDNQVPFMAFNSSGVLMYNCYINDNGIVVDENGTAVDGATITEEGYVKDAFWNVIDPATGTLVQQ